MRSDRASQRSRPEDLLTEIVSAIPERVGPACRHFGACGGCQLQDLPQPAQLRAKRDMLRDLLKTSGISSAPEPVMHAAEEYGYRNRARMRVEGGAVGYSRRASHAFLPVDECPIVTPLIWRAAEALRDLATSGSARWPAETESFELFANGDETALQLSVQVNATVAEVDRNAPRDFRMLADALQRVIPQLVGAGLSVAATPDPSLPRRVQETQRTEIARWGQPHLQYDVAGHTYRVTRNAFFQVNRFLTSTMVDLVVEQRSGTLVYDLFAGAGLFSVQLAQRFAQVVAVEIGQPAAGDLAAHLRETGREHRAVRSTALEFLEQQNRANAPRPDLIVLDPPRAGLGPQALAALIRRGAPQIVYVSCDAGTFARDARALVDSGYSLTVLHLLDLFPQTFHTETIAVLHR